MSSAESAEYFHKNHQVFTVTDLKQFAYCPRIVFYTYCLPLLRPQTYKMRESQRIHEREAAREVRRSLRPYGLDSGTRDFDIPVFAPLLGLRGKIDLVINTGKELIPVDYKLTRRKAGTHFRLQLAAYGLMLDEKEELLVRRGFVYSMIDKQAEEIVLDKRRYARVRRMVKEMRKMVESQIIPAAPKGRGRCVSCEFRRFCNDL